MSFKNAIRFAFFACSLLATSMLHAGETYEGKMKRNTSRFARKIVTPKYVVDGGKCFKFSGTTGSIEVAGQTREVKIAANRRGIYLSMDGDGDGKIVKREIAAVGKGGYAKLTMKYELDGEKVKYPLIFTDIKVHKNKKGEIVNFAFGLIPGWIYAGKVGKLKVVLIDSNLDGEFTQDGQDAICLHKFFATPLLKTHAHKKRFYDFEVSSDGKTVKAAEKDVEVADIAEVGLQYRHKLCRSIIISDGQQAYDIMTTKYIPAGNYNVVCGIFGAKSGIKSRSAYMKPARANPTYEVKAGKLNLLKTGAPIFLSFHLFKGNKNVVRVSPRGMNIFGPVGETFSFPGEISGHPSVGFGTKDKKPKRLEAFKSG